MSQKIDGIKVKIDGDLHQDLKEKLERLVPHFSSFHVLRESIDARRRHDIHRVVSVEIFGPNEQAPTKEIKLEPISYKGPKPIIIGSGPAGLFAALRLAERGIPCILLERGSEAPKRMLAINRYWRYGELNRDDNVCFGEGGAGLYSDGKLMTRIKSPHIPYIMRRLVEFGAPPEIEYLANPHVGSDRIRRVIPVLREALRQKSCEVRFNSKVTKILSSPQTQNGKSQVTGVELSNGEILHSDHIILATGHSATDMYEHLHQIGVSLEGKSFAMGLRIEHPQSLINHTQYRQWADKLPAANYKLTHHDEESGVGVYSFCMCPGGYILSSGTDPDGVVCNGMSNYHRNSPFANSGIVVSIDYQTHFGNDPLKGLKFQRDLEHRFKKSVEESGGTKELPAQKASDFMAARLGNTTATSCPSGVRPARLDQILPDFILKNIRLGLEDFERKIPGFLGEHAQLHGVESRTSSPVRVSRDPETLESLSHCGLYPVGEGAGYAGGITSAAVDGIRAAECLVAQVSSKVLSMASKD